MAKVAQKCEQKLGKLLQERSTKFSKKLKKVKIFSKAGNKFGTISYVPSLVQSAAPSSAHQRGRASGIVGGNFPYWIIGNTDFAMWLPQWMDFFAVGP